MSQQALDQVANGPDTPFPWIESGYYPMLPGPRPLLAGAAALALGNAVLLALPGGAGFLVVNALLLGLVLAATFAIQAPQEPVMDRVNVLTLFGLSLAVTAGVHLLGDQIAPAVKHVVVTVNALILWLAYHLKAMRHAWWITVHVSDHWDAAGLAQYGAFLRRKRPGPGSRRVARELYRVACGEYQKNGTQTAAAAEAMTDYADMLERGEGGRADPQQAKWWRDKAADETASTTGV